jgi:hypothetical protein
LYISYVQRCSVKHCMQRVGYNSGGRSAVGQWNASDRGQVAQLYTVTRIASIKRLAIANNGLMPRCRRGKSTTRLSANRREYKDWLPSATVFRDDLEESFKEVIKITSAL